MKKITFDGVEYGIDMTFQGKDCCIGIGKGTIRALGVPSHVTLKISDNNDSISVLPCDEKDVMAFRVPAKLLTDHHCVMRIHSKRFVHGLMQYNGMDLNRTYIISGEYLEDRNLAVFSLVEDVTLKPLKKNELVVEQDEKGVVANV